MPPPMFSDMGPPPYASLDSGRFCACSVPSSTSTSAPIDADMMDMIKLLRMKTIVSRATLSNLSEIMMWLPFPHVNFDKMFGIWVDYQELRPAGQLVPILRPSSGSIESSSCDGGWCMGHRPCCLMAARQRGYGRMAPGWLRGVR